MSDLISRQAALTALERDEEYDKDIPNRADGVRDAIITISALPSAQQIPWDRNTQNSMVFTLRKVLNGGDMDAVDRNNIKRLLVLMEEGQERWKN